MRTYVISYRIGNKKKIKMIVAQSLAFAKRQLQSKHNEKIKILNISQEFLNYGLPN